jgi:hypothetical protein
MQAMVVNGQWGGKCIDQFPMAVVVVNCPPLWGALTACHPHQRTLAERCRMNKLGAGTPRAFQTLRLVYDYQRYGRLTRLTVRQSKDVRRRSRTFTDIRVRR